MDRCCNYEFSEVQLFLIISLKWSVKHISPLAKLLSKWVDLTTTGAICNINDTAAYMTHCTRYLRESLGLELVSPSRTPIIALGFHLERFQEASPSFQRAPTALNVTFEAQRLIQTQQATKNAALYRWCLLLSSTVPSIYYSSPGHQASLQRGSATAVLVFPQKQVALQIYYCT